MISGVQQEYNHMHFGDLALKSYRYGLDLRGVGHEGRDTASLKIITGKPSQEQGSQGLQQEVGNWPI